MIYDEFLAIGEYGAAGLYEEENRSIFYRKSLGIRRYYENCALAFYNGEYLYPSSVLPKNMKIFPHFMEGMKISKIDEDKIDKTLIDTFKKDFFRNKSTVPLDHTVAGDMYNHSLPNFERVLKEGLLSYIPRIKKIDDKDMREGLLHIIEGIKTYINRIVEYLESVNADIKLINALKNVPLSPAKNLYEAIVAWNFVLYLDNCDNLGCVASGLYPYYKGEDVTDILKNLFDNLDKNDGYSMALHPPYNELTLQCLEASKGKRRPMIELLVNESTPEKVWEKAFEVIRTSNGQPAFYNEKLIKEEFKKRFPQIKDEDLERFCGCGCTESALAGLSNVGALDAGINLLLILEKTIYSKLEISSTFEEFYSFYIDEVKSVAETVCNEISFSQKQRAEFCPAPMRTLLIDDCIDKGKEYFNGGARYGWRIVSFAGMINVIDSMLVIRDYIFNQKLYDAKSFISLLKNNDLDFLKKLRKHNICFGADNDDANNFSKRISTDIYSTLDDKETEMGEKFIPASIMFRAHISSGKDIGATPDGREKGAPLVDSLGAIFGKDTNGPTSLLKSVTSLDLKHALGTPVLNFNINPDFRNETLKALILSYINLGGFQMQITCTSKEELLKAYDNPDLYRNLIVRVGGYSEYFHLLDDKMKKMIIERSIQKA